MKKIISVALALALVLSLGVSAFAAISGKDAENNDITTSPVNGDAKWVSVVADGDQLTVTGSVTGDGSENSVYAVSGGEINVGGTVTRNISLGGDAIFAMDDSTKVVVVGTVTEEAGGSAINARSGAAVEVGSVDEKNDGHAINALSGANVIVHGDITEDGANNAINAEDGATVKVEGNITEKGEDSAIRAMDGATVIVFGNVEENDYGVSLACGNATIMVGGDVTKVGGGTAISANNAATVIVEGIVSGNTRNNSATLGAADLYLGQLNGTIIEENSDLNHIFYLIGFTDNELLKYIGYEDPSSILEYKEEGIEGAKKDYYFVTNTADAEILKGKSVTLKPNDSNKILTVSGFDGANVKYVANENGTVTFTIGENFKGGMQNLVLILKDKSGPSPVYYLVPLGSATTASVKLPAGVAEGLIKALDSADHAGITVDSSLVGDGSVKVLKDGKELSAKDFSTYTHADGSIDVILSNTYLFALGSGSYDFTAQVGGTEIEFTVLVAEA